MTLMVGYSKYPIVFLYFLPRCPTAEGSLPAYDGTINVREPSDEEGSLSSSFFLSIQAASPDDRYDRDHVIGLALKRVHVGSGICQSL